MIHHFPCRLERDIYTLLGFQRHTQEGLQRCLTGLMICLGDGIRESEWQWLQERFAVGFVQGVKKILAPTLIWSDAALRNTLPAYISQRRWTLHKTYYEMRRQGVLCGAVARIEDLEQVSGAVLVPNFDLLADVEKSLLANYRGGPVVATAMSDFALSDWNIVPEVQFVDQQVDRPMQAFIFNSSLGEQEQSTLAALASEIDGAPELQGELSELPEPRNVLQETLTFTKVSKGFVRACAELLRLAEPALFTCNLPMVAMAMNDGSYRLYITHDNLLGYGFAVVSAKKAICNVENVSKYPLLPVKFMASPEDTVGWAAQNATGKEKHFRVKVAPGGLSIVDVTLADK